MVEHNPSHAGPVGPQASEAAPPLAAALRSTRIPMVITDPRLNDNPIVFANQAFLALTGYERDEVVGRNCRFLQGPDTDPQSVTAIREAVRAGRDIAIELLNVRKDGSAFWNALSISPIVEDGGPPVYFVGAQIDITGPISRRLELEAARSAQDQRTATLEQALDLQQVLAQEIDHRVKNNLQMISAMLMLQTMNIPDTEVRRTLTGMLARVDAIALVHQRLYQSSQSAGFDVAEFLQELGGHVIGAAGRDDVSLTFRLTPVVIASDQAASLALMVNEGLTNAVKHGLRDGRPGRITITLTRADRMCTILIEDDGVGLPPGQGASPSFGTTLLQTLAVQIAATLEWRPASPGPGTVLAIAFPLAL